MILCYFNDPNHNNNHVYSNHSNVRVVKTILLAYDTDIKILHLRKPFLFGIMITIFYSFYTKFLFFFTLGFLLQFVTIFYKRNK